MKKILEALSLGENYFGSSSINSKEFNSFFTTFKVELTKELTKINATEIEFHKGHFDICGFFRAKSGQLYYFSLSDVRWSIGGDYDKLLFRTAKHNKDWSGGCNQYIKLSVNMWDGVKL